MSLETVQVVRKRPLYGAGSIWDTTSVGSPDNAQWDQEPEDAQGTPAIRVVDALRAMGDGELSIGPHRFTAIAGVPFEKPDGVIVRDLNDRIPTKTWFFGDFITMEGVLLEGFEEETEHARKAALFA